MKQTHIKPLLAALALLAVLISGCTNENFDSPADNGKNLTVAIGTVANTRVAFRDEAVSGIKLTWQAGDELALYNSGTGNLDAILQCIAIDANSGKGTFIVKTDLGRYDQGQAYEVRYPAMGSDAATSLADYPATLSAYEEAKTARMQTGQTQQGATMDHLADLCFMEGTKGAGANALSLAHTMAVMTFKMDKPAEIPDTELPVKITFDNGASVKYELTLAGTQAWGKEAYIIIRPEEGGTERTLTFTVTANTGRTYATTVPDVTTPYAAGKRYSAKLTDVYLVTRQPDVKVSSADELTKAFTDTRQDGDIIQLISDFEVATPATFNQPGIAVIFDLNGKTVTGTTSEGIIQMQGTSNLTVEDYSEANNGTLTAPGSTLRNDGTGTLTVSGGTVQATGENGSAIWNEGIGTLIVSGSTLVTSVATGSSGTIYLNASHKDGNPVLKIEGGTVSNTATDGNAIYNNAAGACNNFDVAHTSGKVEGKWFPEISVATIGYTGYATLEAAFAAAIDGNTIVMQKDYTASITPKYTCIIYEVPGATVTLDLNGKTLTGPELEIGVIMMDENSNLIVEDNSGTGKGLFTVPNIALTNVKNGTLTIRSGTVQSTGIGGYCISNNGSQSTDNGRGRVIVSGGTVQSTGRAGRAIYNRSCSTNSVTISGGTVQAIGGEGWAAIYNERYGLITISGDALVTKDSSDDVGTITLIGRGNNGNPVLKIEGGTVSNTSTGGKQYAVYSRATTQAEIDADVKWTGGVVVGNWKPYRPYRPYDPNDPNDPNNVAKIDNIGYLTLEAAFAAAVNGSKIVMQKDYSYATAITYNVSGATVILDLNGKTVTSTDATNGAIKIEGTSSLTVTNNSTTNSGILTAPINTLWNDGTGTLTVNGGTVDATGSNGRAIYNNSIGLVTISGNAVVTSGATGGTGTIYLTKRTGSTPVLNIQGGTVKNTAGGFVIYNNATGANNKIDVTQTGGNVSGNWFPVNIEPGDVAKIGTTGYATLEAAFAAASDGSKIVMLKNYGYATEILYEVPGATVTLDLNGYTVTATSKSGAIQIRGASNLTVEDNSTAKNGVLTSTSGFGITNYGTGTLNVRSGTVQINYSSGSSGVAIYNFDTGAVNVSGGKVEANGSGADFAIYNRIGTVTVSGGTVQSTDSGGVAIYNQNTGLITVKGTAVVTSCNTGIDRGTIYLNNRSGTPVLKIEGGTVSNTATSGNKYAIYNSASSPDNSIDVLWTGGSITPENAYPLMPTRK